MALHQKDIIVLRSSWRPRRAEASQITLYVYLQASGAHPFQQVLTLSSRLKYPNAISTYQYLYCTSTLFSMDVQDSVWVHRSWQLIFHPRCAGLSFPSSICYSRRKLVSRRLWIPQPHKYSHLHQIFPKLLLLSCFLILKCNWELFLLCINYLFNICINIIIYYVVLDLQFLIYCIFILEEAVISSYVILYLPLKYQTIYNDEILKAVNAVVERK